MRNVVVKECPWSICQEPCVNMGTPTDPFPPKTYFVEKTQGTYRTILNSPIDSCTTDKHRARHELPLPGNPSGQQNGHPTRAMLFCWGASSMDFEILAVGVFRTGNNYKKRWKPTWKHTGIEEENVGIEDRPTYLKGNFVVIIIRDLLLLLRLLLVVIHHVLYNASSILRGS